MDPLILPQLFLDGTDTPLESNPREIDRYYIPLAQYILQVSHNAERAIIAVAGPPACGKSAFTLLLTEIINALSRSHIASPAGLDGWHYPNSYLDSHTVQRQGQDILLRKIKGAPESFDVGGVRAFLHQARNGKTIDYPLYSRRFHDPVPNAAHLRSDQSILIIEGNYLLLSEPPWLSLQNLFDLKLFLNAPRPALIQALRERHLRGGKDPDWVENHLITSDIPNLDRILENQIPADIRIEKFDCRLIEDVIYPGSARHLS